MLINFNNMEEEVMHEFLGGNNDVNMRRYLDDNKKIMKLTLNPGSSIGMHEHVDNMEIIYVLSGEATILYDDTTEIVKVGECHYCPKGHAHSTMNKGSEDLVFFAVVA